MGDRISVSFKQDGRESVAFFAHWGGKEFTEEVREYITRLDKEVPRGHTYPLERREPSTVMVDFILHTIPKERAMSNFYLGKDRNSTSLSPRSEEHTSELQSPCNLVCRLLLEKKKQQ